MIEHCKIFLKTSCIWCNYQGVFVLFSFTGMTFITTKGAILSEQKNCIISKHSRGNVSNIPKEIEKEKKLKQQQNRHFIIQCSSQKSCHCRNFSFSQVNSTSKKCTISGQQPSSFKALFMIFLFHLTTFLYFRGILKSLHQKHLP